MKLQNRKMIFSISIVLFIGACSFYNPEHTADNLKISADKDFITKAGYANRAEIDFGQMASTKSMDNEIKSFGQQMVKDHTMAQDELKKLASTKNVNMPDTLDAAHKSLKKKLTSLSGSEFDKAYVQSQIDDHQKVLKEFQMIIKQGKDKEIVDYAKKNIHHIQMHLDKAKMLQKMASKK